jgi:kanamycin kinase
LFSGEPSADVRVPGAVIESAAGERISPTWINELGGLTFALGDGPTRRFIKWSPPGGIDLRREADKLRWAATFVTVPPVLQLGSDSEGSWLITSGLRGQNAVTARWKADPATAVAAIGAGLRELHDTLPVADCPFSWSQPDRLAVIDHRIPLLEPSGWRPEHRDLTVGQALARLADPPPVDQLVVCHGDACAPNTLLDDDGTCSGRVDLGALGVADRWADLAIATWSTQWNYGPGWADPLLEAYGIAPDPDRTDYYRLLWDLGP